MELTDYDLELMEQKYGRRDSCDDCGAEMWGFKRIEGVKLQCAACFIKSEGGAVCERCDGRGHEPGNRTITCGQCKGSGKEACRAFSFSGDAVSGAGLQ